MANRVYGTIGNRGIKAHISRSHILESVCPPHRGLNTATVTPEGRDVCRRCEVLAALSSAKQSEPK